MLKKLVSLGENVGYKEQHIKNIKNMIGKERIFKQIANNPPFAFLTKSIFY